MARDEHGEIPNPWARTAFGDHEYVDSLFGSRACVGGPLHKRMMPEDNMTFVVEVDGAHHTYKLMRDVASGELCYVHIGHTGGG